MNSGKDSSSARPTGADSPHLQPWQKRVPWKVVPVILAFFSLLTAGYFGTFTPVKIIDGERVIPLSTHQTTVGAALNEVAIALNPEDIVTPPLNAPLNRNDTIIIQRARLVKVNIDNKDIQLVHTQSQSAAEVIASLGITPSSQDSILVNGQFTDQLPPRAQPTEGDDEAVSAEISLKRAQSVTIQEQGQPSITLQTTLPTVGEALMQAGYKIYLADRVSPLPGEPIKAGEQISITRSKPVSVWVDGRRLKTRTLAASVADVLAGLNVVLYGEDYTQPDLQAPIADGQEIRVVRVRHEIVIDQEVIPFDTRHEADPDVELDHEVLGQEGVPGVHERRTLVTYEDNNETKRELIADFIARQPEPKIYKYGTKVVLRTLNTPNGQVQYWRVIRMLATSYSASTAGVSLGAPYYGRVRCGFAMRGGVVAVDTSMIPLRTNIYVEGYGIGSACDTGSAITGKRIDLGYDDNNLQLWYRWVDVYLLTPVPDDIRYNLD
jgi:uncharacterized protein YabE (DUF348 family)